MSITTHRPTTVPTTTDAVSVASDATVEVRRSGRRLALLVGGLALVTAVAVTGWIVSSQPTEPAPVDWSAYGPGSAVYDEQVPTVSEAASSLASSLADGYGPGSTTYREQVPSLAREAARIAEGYGPGSTTYSEQVPAAGR